MTKDPSEGDKSVTEVRVQLKDHLIAWGDPQWDRGEAHTELRLPAKDALEHPHSLFAAMVLHADGTGEVLRLSLQIGGPGLSLTLLCGDVGEDKGSCQMSAGGSSPDCYSQQLGFTSILNSGLPQWPSST